MHKVFAVDAGKVDFVVEERPDHVLLRLAYGATLDESFEAKSAARTIDALKIVVKPEQFPLRAFSVAASLIGKADTISFVQQQSGDVRFTVKTGEPEFVDGELIESQRLPAKNLSPKQAWQGKLLVSDADVSSCQVSISQHGADAVCIRLAVCQMHFPRPREQNSFLVNYPFIFKLSGKE